MIFKDCFCSSVFYFIHAAFFLFLSFLHVFSISPQHVLPVKMRSGQVSDLHETMSHSVQSKDSHITEVTLSSSFSYFSGESGAGKTECTKLIIKQLIDLCQGNSQLQQQILQVKYKFTAHTISLS